MQKPKPTDFDNEQDYLNNWAGWQVQSGSWSEPVPTDWKAPVVTPQPDGMLTNTTTPTEDTYTAPPTDYVPEYVQPKTTQVEDLFLNELGSSTEADDPFAIDVESEDTYTAPPADYVPEYTAPVNAATGYREDDDVSSSPEVLVNAATGYREDDDVSSSPDVSQDTDPFGDYNRVLITGQDINVDYSSDPSLSQDQRDASGLAYRDYTDDALSNVTFDTVEARGGDYTNFGSRLISGDTEEYDAIYSYNNMLNRGIDEATAQEWWDSGGSANDANEIIAKNFVGKQDNFLSSIDDILETGTSSEFSQQYNDSNLRGKIAIADSLRQQGTLTDEQFSQLYIDEWNADQRGKPSPRFIVKTKAPKSSSGIDTIYRGEDAFNYEAGDDIYVLYDPTTPEWQQDETVDVIDPRSFFPPDKDHPRGETATLSYYDNFYPKTEQSAYNSEWVNFRDEFLIPSARLVLAVSTGGTSEKLYSAVKLATGETLHGSDYANLVVGGLEMAEVITAPTEVVDPNTGEIVKTAGQGLSIGGLNLSYEATTSLINGLGEKNPVAVVTSLMGDKWPDTLKGFGVPATLVDDPDFMKAFNKGLNVALDGGNLEDVLTESVEKYIKEGGSFGVLPEGDYDFSMFDGLGDVLEPFMDVLKEVAGATEDLLKPVVDVIADAAEPIINTADDIIDATGDVIGDTVDVVADTFEPVVDAADDVLDAVGDTLEDLADALPDVPDVPDLPDLPDLPDVPLPDLNLNLPSMGMLSGTRTTDSLFGKDLFKFKTKIGVSPQEQLMQAPQRKQQKQEYDNLFEDPFASTFNFKV